MDPTTICAPHKTTNKNTSPSYEKQIAKTQTQHHPLTQTKTKWLENPQDLTRIKTKQQTKHDASYMVTNNTHHVHEYTTHTNTGTAS